MSNWNQGYVTDIAYTQGYYHELNPQRCHASLLTAGWRLPDGLQDAPACELGFGHGVSINVHAAATGQTWFGNDFNPAQTAFAQRLARASGAPAHLSDEAFADFCNRTDLPDFGFIGLHGIWSWVSDDNRRILVDFIRRKLRVGGVLYISYNTFPGWSSMAPVRELMADYATTMCAPGQGTIAQVDAALAFTQRLCATDPMFLRAHPTVTERLKQMQGLSRNYLAHEYFNQNWEPMSFAALTRWLEPAKLTFAASAHYLDLQPGLNFSPAQLALLQEQTDPTFRETVRDFLVNQQFRRDYWIKGAQRSTASVLAEQQQAQTFLLVTPPAKIKFTAKTQIGEAQLTPAVYDPVVAELADHRAHTVGELWDRLQARGAKISLAQLWEALVILTAKSDVTSVCTTPDEPVRATARRFNERVCKQAPEGTQIGWLASTVSGGAVSVARFDQVFLLAQAKQPNASPTELAQDAWARLKADNQRLLREGKPLLQEAENLTELTRMAQEFLGERSATLQRLGVHA